MGPMRRGSVSSLHLRGSLANEPATPNETDIELEALFARPHVSLEAPEIDVELIRPAWRRDLYELLEQPNSSTSAFAIHVLSTALILLSATVTVLETVSYFHSTSPRVWFGIETTLVLLFTVEYLGRTLAWSSDRKMFFGWFLSFYGIIDFLAIVPFYIELAFQVDTSVIFRFSILRTFRLLRVFRAFRSNNTILLTIEVMFLSVKRSQHALLALGFFLLMFVLVFSTLIYFVERGTWDSILEIFVDADGEPSQFPSIPAAAWFVLVTISTVGYGEVTPRSFLGRVITVPLLIFGLLLIALPSFVLGREFSSIWDALTAQGGPVSPRIESAQSSASASGTAGSSGSRPKVVATNIYDLSQQVLELQSALNTQGQMLRRLVRTLERTSHNPNNSYAKNDASAGLNASFPPSRASFTSDDVAARYASSAEATFRRDFPVIDASRKSPLGDDEPMSVGRDDKGKGKIPNGGIGGGWERQ